MVAIAQSIPRNEFGEIDRATWFNLLSIRYPKEKLTLLMRWLGLTTPKSLEIANILLELHADLDAILAALLIGHTGQLEQDQFKELPSHIRRLLHDIEDLNRVSKTLFVQKRQSKIEGIRQMMLAMIKDVRVVLVKLAERTFAARQMKLLAEAEKIRLAHEIRELYAPLANRLGIGALKWELEDRAFAVLEPEAYQHLTVVLKSRRAEREAFIQNFLEALETELQHVHIKAEVTGRVKHFYSIWRKMQKKGLRFEDLYDVRAVRILVRDIPSCYTVMALLHAQWTPLVSEYTDYIVTPKANGYRSLHTVLIGEDSLPIEVQIRTFDMHEQAESGIAAHWQYKEGGNNNAAAQERVAWLRTLLDWQAQTLPEETENSLVYVFTKDNEVFAIKQGATPIDFAFMIHTSVGLRTKGALVNGKMAALTTALETGDQVEILLHKTPNPSRDWLIPSHKYLATTQAKRKLRAYFREIDSITKPVTADTNAIANSDSFLPKSPKSPKSPKGGQSRSNPKGISISGVQNMPFELARCCMPTENDSIIASITRARGLVIHRQNCHNITYFQKKRPERLFKTEWALENNE